MVIISPLLWDNQFPWEITETWIHKVAEWCQTVTLARIFLSTPQPMKDSYNLQYDEIWGELI